MQITQKTTKKHSKVLNLIWLRVSRKIRNNDADFSSLNYHYHFTFMRKCSVFSTIKVCLNKSGNNEIAHLSLLKAFSFVLFLTPHKFDKRKILNVRFISHTVYFINEFSIVSACANQWKVATNILFQMKNLLFILELHQNEN